MLKNQNLETVFDQYAVLLYAKFLTKCMYIQINQTNYMPILQLADGSMAECSS